MNLALIFLIAIFSFSLFFYGRSKSKSLSIENNYKLKVIETKDELFNIDTPSDVSIVRKAMKKDTLSKKYL